MPIEVKNLSHTYMAGTPFESKALDDISFTINDGEFIGIIGHTVLYLIIGKSRLLKHTYYLVINGCHRITQRYKIIIFYLPSF